MKLKYITYATLDSKTKEHKVVAIVFSPEFTHLFVHKGATHRDGYKFELRSAGFCEILTQPGGVFVHQEGSETLKMNPAVGDERVLRDCLGL